MNNKKFLIRQEAADYLRISLRKLDQLASDGEIPYSKMGSGQKARVLYRREDLDLYVDNNLVHIQKTTPRVNLI